MTPAEQVRLTCEALGEGGQSKLARLLPSFVPGRTVNPRTVRGWLTGRSTPKPEYLEAMAEIRKTHGGTSNAV